MQRWYESGIDGTVVGLFYLWKLLLEEPGKIDNFSFALSADLQDCDGSVLSVSHHMAYRLYGLRYISLGSQPSGDSNIPSFEFEIWAPGLSTIRTTVACGPFSPCSSFHCTPVPTSKRLNSPADKVFL
jgi:hypothetical protein